VAVDPGDPETFFLARSTGGLFKISNDGDTFAPVLDHEAALSVGAVAVSPPDPRAAWVCAAGDLWGPGVGSRSAGTTGASPGPSASCPTASSTA
jgi:hypothetical protein